MTPKPRSVQSAKSVKQQSAPTTHAPGTFSINLKNVSAPDAVFLGEIAAIFCDPDRSSDLHNLKSGRTCICMTGRGQVHLVAR